MSEVAEDTLLATITQFLSEVEFDHPSPQSWENEQGGQEFTVTAYKNLGNGLFKVHIQGDEQAQQVMFYCTWDIHVPPRKRQEVAELVARLNYDLCVGNFEFDFRDGEVRFKTTLVYEGIPLNFANLRAHFYTSIRMMNRSAPWVESVIISEHTALEAADLAKQPVET